MLSRDSQACQPDPAANAGGENGTAGDSGSGPGGPSAPDSAGTPPTAGVLPAGFAGKINLTIPLTNLLDLADRPGEMAGIGPIDRIPEQIRRIVTNQGISRLWVPKSSRGLA